MFERARIKLMFIFASLFALLYLVTAAGVYVWMLRTTVGEVDQMLATGARPVVGRLEISLFLRQGMSLNGVDPQIGLGHPESNDSVVILRDNRGKLLTSTQPQIAAQVPYIGPNNLSDMIFFSIPISHPKTIYRLVTVPLFSPIGQLEGYVQFGRNIASELSVLSRLAKVLITVGISGLILAALAGFYMSGRVLRPIKKSWKRQQQFVADASHELRTPLAVIQTNLDIVLGHAAEGVDENLEWLNHAQSEARRLTRLTQDLLTLARADGNEHLLNVQDIWMDEVILEVVESLEIIAEAKGIVLLVTPELTASGHVSVRGDRDRIHQLVYILLDNAIKYTEPGGRVTVNMTRQKQSIRIQVIDTGIGMNSKEMSQAFERFYRGDQARERAAGGTGLGLAIAKWIVTSHHGRLTVHSELGKGSTFSVTLPTM